MNKIVSTIPTDLDAARRQFLISAMGATAIATVCALSPGFALAQAPTEIAASRSALPCCDITLLRHQTGLDQSIEIVNHTSKPVTLRKFSSTGFAKPQGSLSVSISLPEQPVTLLPKQVLSLRVQARTANAGWNLDAQAIPNLLAGQIEVQSDQPAFNGIIPVIVFDAIPA